MHKLITDPLIAACTTFFTGIPLTLRSDPLELRQLNEDLLQRRLTQRVLLYEGVLRLFKFLHDNEEGAPGHLLIL